VGRWVIVGCYDRSRYKQVENHCSSLEQYEKFAQVLQLVYNEKSKQSTLKENLATLEKITEIIENV